MHRFDPLPHHGPYHRTEREQPGRTQCVETGVPTLRLDDGARLHEITGRTEYASASRTFWSAVTNHHSYVIGGSGDRYVTEQTCETCAGYNMLKLTRQLYARTLVSTFLDYYEHTHLNHILAQQNPRTGMFAHMTPLLSGSGRIYFSPFDDFWCCVGTGMESHARHGDSIFWHAAPDTPLVNLFIPAQLD